MEEKEKPVLVQETVFSVGLPTRQKQIYTVYLMKKCEIKKEALRRATMEYWGLKSLSIKPVDELFAREGFKEDKRERWESMLEDELIPISDVMVTNAKRPEGYQDRKLFFNLKNLLNPGENNTGGNLGDITFQGIQKDE